jgi:hypothetical protein
MDNDTLHDKDPPYLICGEGIEASGAFFKRSNADSCSIPCRHLAEKKCTVEKAGV